VPHNVDGDPDQHTNTQRETAIQAYKRNINSIRAPRLSIVRIAVPVPKQTPADFTVLKDLAGSPFMIKARLPAPMVIIFI